MLNSLNSNIKDALDQYNKIKYPNGKSDVEDTEDTVEDSEIEDSEDAIDEIIDKKINDDDDNTYNLSFEQQTMIQQQMQMESMITQFNLANQASKEGTTYTAPLDYSILQGQQLADQIGVINTNVSASTEGKNEYISDRFVNKNDDETDEVETDETDDNSVDNSENIKHIDLHL